MNQVKDALTLSEAAVAEIVKLTKENNLPETAGVRVGVQGGGCSGFTYTLSFDKDAASGDHILEQDGVRVFIDPKSIIYLSGVVLDHTSGLQGKGFQFKNPNAESTCGCGESFSV